MAAFLRVYLARQRIRLLRHIVSAIRGLRSEQMLRDGATRPTAVPDLLGVSRVAAVRMASLVFRTLTPAPAGREAKRE